MRYDVAVIGSGIAGLNFALRSAEKGFRVVLITKKRVANSATNFAQGGIAAVLEQTDNFKQHIKDTLEAGSYNNNRAAVEYMVTRGPAAIHRLLELGVPFATREDGELMLTREGGHRARRIAFVGDYTGREIERTLVRKARQNPLITILENTFAVDLLVRNKICYGVQILHNGRVTNIFTPITVLATGGLGQIYRHTTNPDIATGDGFAMAQRAGCILKDMEFIQFHPTALNVRLKRMFLISEAVRGEGAYLRNKDGKRFMVKLHQLAELAPRDVVARAIFKELASGRVFLDLRHKNPRIIRKRFPQIYTTLKKYKLDLTKDLVPITPAAHYSCGGVHVDFGGKTNIQNLFALGEVTHTGVHGANRLASNSLLEALVFSDTIMRHIKKIPQKFPKNANFRRLRMTQLTIAENRELTRLKKEIQKILWDDVGIIRNTADLKNARNMLERIAMILSSYKGFHVKLWEVKNMAETGLSVIEAALKRKKSLGCHYRMA